MGDSERRGRGFRLFPQYKHGLKHLLYDSSALFELLRRADKQATPSTWTVFNEAVGDEAGSRAYWRRYFTCPSNFGYSMQTDGVAVSLTMLRRQRLTETSGMAKKKMKVSKLFSGEHATPLSEPFTSYVAVDPGAREPIVTCTADENGKFVFRKLTAARVYFETGELWRDKRRRKITAAVDKNVREDEKKIEAAEDYSSKHGGDPRAYAEFRNRHFERLQRAYENRKLARLKFEKYSRRQKFMSDVVKEYFPDRGKIILYGAGCKFMNRATFRGHRKFSHDSLLRELKRSGRIVRLVDESYTTKRCFRCFGASTVKVGPSPHRYVHCPVCHRGVNRDQNGAANILLKSTGRWKSQNSQPSLPLCGGGTDFRPAI